MSSLSAKEQTSFMSDVCGLHCEYLHEGYSHAQLFTFT